MDLNAILDIAVSAMKYKTSRSFREVGDKFYHGQRVAESAKQLCQLLGYETDLDILTVAAWFHDICNGEGNHELAGANKTIELLTGLCSEEELSAIWELIVYHDSRHKEDLKMEIQILQDADRIDHNGVFEIWEGFLYAKSQNMSLNEAAEHLLGVNRCREDEHEVNTVHFACSKKIYEEKMAFIRSFVARMQVEGAGKFMPF